MLPCQKNCPIHSLAAVDVPCSFQPHHSGTDRILPRLIDLRRPR